MQLRQPEPLGMLDHHDGRLGYVDPDLDNGGGDEQPGLAGGEPRHGGILFGALEPAVDKTDEGAEALLQEGEALLRCREVDGLGFLDQRAHPIDPLAALDGAADRRDDFLHPPERNDAGVDRQAAGGLLAQLGNVHVAEKRKHQCARDRSRGQHQDVDRRALLGERQPLVDAEPVLLVDHGQREILEHHLLLEQRVRADQDVEVAAGEPLEDIGALAPAFTTGEDRNPNAGGFGERRHRLEVLARQDLGRRHHGRLTAGLDHRGGGQQRHDCLARPDVALQQPQHALRLAEILDDLADRADLRGRQRIGQGIDDPAAP